MQTLSLDDDIYFLLILGMVAVGAHAYTLFNLRITGTNSSQRWQFLDNIPIQLVTKKSSFNYGFLIYLLLFELIYLVLASSSSLVLMMYQISGREELTGALSESVKPSGAVPILASTAIILLSQVRPFSAFELTLRTMTHRYARIPENMKSVKQNIMKSLHEKPLIFPNEHDSNRMNADDRQTNRRKEGVLKTCVEKWINNEFSEEDSASFIKSYWNTLCLNEYTLESVGNSIWDADESEEILRLFRSTEHEVAQLRSAVEAAALKKEGGHEDPRAAQNDQDFVRQYDTGDQNDRQSSDEANENKPVTQASVAQWKTQKKKCTELEERLALLLSLLIINQPDVETTDDQQLHILISAAQSQQKNDIANFTFSSTLVGGIVMLTLFTFYFIGEAGLKSKIRQDPSSSKAPFGDYVERQLQAEAENAEVYRWSGLHLRERQIAANEKSTLFLENSSSLNTAISETILILLIYASSISIALANRGHHIRLKEWNVVMANNKVYYPVSKYYMTCTYSMACTSAVIFVYYFMTLALFQALKDNKDVLALDVIDPFMSFMPSLVSTSMIAWVCAYFSLFAMDVILSDKNKLINSPEVGNNVTRIDLSADTVARVSILKSISTSLFFGLICALVAVTGKLYLNSLISLWDASSTFILNFTGFSVLFYCFFRSVKSFGMHTLTERIESGHDESGEGPDVNPYPQEPSSTAEISEQSPATPDILHRPVTG